MQYQNYVTCPQNVRRQATPAARALKEAMAQPWAAPIGLRLLDYEQAVRDHQVARSGPRDWDEVRGAYKAAWIPPLPEGYTPFRRGTVAARLTADAYRQARYRDMVRAANRVWRAALAVAQ